MRGGDVCPKPVFAFHHANFPRKCSSNQDCKLLIFIEQYIWVMGYLKVLIQVQYFVEESSRNLSQRW